MNFRTNNFLLIIAAFLTASASARDKEPASDPEVSPQPVYLLSERDLGSGVKVCFMSNGLQMRLQSDKVCPFPLKAPPFDAARQNTSPNGPSSQPPASSLEAGNKGAVETPKLVEPPKSPIPKSASSTSAAPTPPAVLKRQDPTPQRAADQQTISKGVTQPAPPTQINNSTSKAQVVAEGNSVDPRDAIEDEIADKAIRRCERIGFKSGTEPFKLCAIEQIKILSGYRP